MKRKLLFKFYFLGITIIACWLIGCNSTSAPGEKGEIITTTQFKELKKQKSSDGKRIAVIGKVTVANSNLTRKLGSATSMTVDDRDDKLIDFFNLNYGQDKNEFYLPAEFTPKDLKVYDNDGNAHAYNEPVQISFTMKRKTEVRPEQNEQTGEYFWEYEKIRIDTVAKK